MYFDIFSILFMYFLSFLFMYFQFFVPFSDSQLWSRARVSAPVLLDLTVFCQPRVFFMRSCEKFWLLGNRTSVTSNVNRRRCRVLLHTVLYPHQQPEPRLWFGLYEQRPADKVWVFGLEQDARQECFKGLLSNGCWWSSEVRGQSSVSICRDLKS